MAEHEPLCQDAELVASLPYVGYIISFILRVDQRETHTWDQGPML
jgi:hypothetical protein